MSTLIHLHSTYISNHLIKEIGDKIFPNEIHDVEIEDCMGLDGFMSKLYTLSYKVSDKNTGEVHSESLIVKFMKRDEAFRVSSRSYIQFANEILIYAEVIPYYSQVLKNIGVATINTEDWIPKVYAAKYGQIEGLCGTSTTSNESVLALENLKPKGYVLGPPPYLDRAHMRLMLKTVAEYHAMTYALKILKDPHINILIDKIIPLPFIEGKGTKDNFYDAIYRAAFDRFYEYFERSKETLINQDDPDDVGLEKNINKVKEKYGKHPTSLLERIRVMDSDEDQKFAAILHGDFNRNNVLFKYEEGTCSPIDVKLIDFQELRYGSPCIDLSFAMYMNMDKATRDEYFLEALKDYHNTLSSTISAVVTGKNKDENILPLLDTYSFNEFYKHFSKYAFYGVMICMHFLPWLCGTEEELSLLSKWFEENVHGEEFRKLSLTVGGDDANLKIFEIVKHAHRMGYMDYI